VSDTTITQTCACAASFTITVADRRDALDAVKAWADTHATTCRMTAPRAGFNPNTGYPIITPAPVNPTKRV
jgi:hypothetical protein